MQLRSYQSQALHQLILELHRRPILVAPTGAGKTVMGAELVRRLGARTLWIADRRELIHQAAGKLTKLGLHTGVMLAGERRDEFARVHVASIQTLVRREIPKVSLVVVDECDLAAAESYEVLFALGVPVVGLTATPFRLDGRSLGDLFGSIVVAAQTADLVEAGYLHEPRVFIGKKTPRITLDTKDDGDFDTFAVAKLMRKAELVGDIVSEWERQAPARKTVCFAINVEHSQEIAAAFAARGVPAEHLDGSTPARTRDAILERLKDGRTMVVSNVGVLTRGWDLPELGCIIIARPTASLNLHLQMLGRAMRVAEGKDDAIVLDHAGNHYRHGPATRRLIFSLEAGPKCAQSGELLGLRRCMKCGILYDNSLDQCPDCGHIPPVDGARGKIQESAGTLEEFDDSSHTVRAGVWEAIRQERDENGYEIGWALHRFKERFGAWPAVMDDKLIDPACVDMQYRRRVFEMYDRIAAERGFKPGWASVRYKEIFGCWPTGFVGDVRMKRLMQTSGGGQ